MRVAIGAALALSLSACAAAPKGLPPAAVTAVAETEPVGTAAEDAADDPAVWRNAADPAASLIVATDKKAGLYVYGLDGRTRSFVEGGLLNNVDLLDMGPAGVIVVASDRNDLASAMLQVYRLDTGTAELKLLGKVPGGAGEGYGLCLHKAGERLLAYSALKAGTVQEVEIALGAGAPAGTMRRTMTIPSQIEGCVTDPADGTLYVGEERAGIWRFAPGTNAGELVARVDDRQLVADVEGLAILREPNRAVLVASSQGDNAYAVFALPAMTPLGRFAIVPGTVGGAEETDGIELTGGGFGPGYPDGLLVAQDGHNQPRAQNFKLVSWAAVKAALGID